MKTLDTRRFKELKQRKRDMTILNVLPEPAFESAHIPGSLNVPVEDRAFEARARKHVASAKDPVVVYCQNESCDASTQAAERLEKAGFEDVYDYTGGIEAWALSGLPVAGKGGAQTTTP